MARIDSHGDGVVGQVTSKAARAVDVSTSGGPAKPPMRRVGFTATDGMEAPRLFEMAPTMVHKRSVSYATGGMVAASHPQAVQIGVDILKKGGSAIDAALATNIALGVMEPGMCGMGGDLFAIVWDNKAKRLYGLNASGRSPLKLTADKVQPGPDGTIPIAGPASMSVPGAVDGWAKLHQRFGKLDWAELFKPAIAAAEDGVPVAPVVAKEWDWPGWLPKAKDHHGFAETFLPNGKLPKPGQIFRNPELAKSLRLVAEGGRDAFYKGQIARDIVAVAGKVSGFFSLADFDREHAEWVEPVGSTFGGTTVWQLPPNCQGVVALQMLNILECFDLKSIGRDSPLYWHILIEAKKLAFEDRARHYADPDFAKIPIATLVSKEYAKKQAARIDLDKAADRYEGDPVLDRGDTTYLSVADKDGNMVSLIQSNFMPFGSGNVVGGFGIQNRGALFNLKPGHPNSLVPGKRPFNTIMPGFVTKDGKPLMSFGVMGGNMQPLGHMQVLVNHLLFGDDIQVASDRPRFQHEGSSEPTGPEMKTGGVLFLEQGVPDYIREGLAARGHKVQPAGGYFGGCQIVKATPDGYEGASESRKDGLALGYNVPKRDRVS